MSKEMKCGDIVPGCKAVLSGKDENEVMQQAAQHAKKDHGMMTLPPDVAAKAKAAIHERP